MRRVLLLHKEETGTALRSEKSPPEIRRSTRVATGEPGEEVVDQEVVDQEVVCVIYFPA